MSRRKARSEDGVQLSKDEVQLIDMPVEIILAVYQDMHTVQDVLSLSNTCKILRRIWTSNARGILEEVMPRQFADYRAMGRLPLDVHRTVSSTI